MFPENDDQFEDTTIAAVEGSAENGWLIDRADHWSFYVQKDSPVEPKVGMIIRFYGKGIGSMARGLFIDGQKVYYRTVDEDKEYREKELYGADAAEWLKRWDAGKTVWSIEMGGLGPGYEQCIAITTAEILRVMLTKQYDADAWSDKAVWKHDRDEIDTLTLEVPVIKNLGLSGAQWGGALSVASFLYRKGPRGVMTDERVKDRHIQVQRTFPVAA